MNDFAGATLREGRAFGGTRGDAASASDMEEDMQTKRRDRGAGRRAGCVRRALFALCLVALAFGSYLTGGFLRFAEEVATLRTPTDLDGADGIVVLTGGTLRIDRALALLERGEGQRLLITGVNPGTGVRSLTRLTGADEALFACCVDLDYDALDTIGNAEMTTRWAREHGMDRIVLVTSDYHIPRSVIELASVANAPAIVPYPVSPEKLWRADGAPTRLGVRLLLTEYAKVLATRVRLALGLDYDRAGLRRTAHVRGH